MVWLRVSSWILGALLACAMAACGQTRPVVSDSVESAGESDEARGSAAASRPHEIEISRTCDPVARGSNPTIFVTTATLPCVFKASSSVGRVVYLSRPDCFIIRRMDGHEGLIIWATGPVKVSRGDRGISLETAGHKISDGDFITGGIDYASPTSDIVPADTECARSIPNVAYIDAIQSIVRGPAATSSPR